MTVHLSLGCTDSDIMRPLLNDTVEPDGVELTTIANRPSKRHRRFFEHPVYDICEISMASYLSSRTVSDDYEFTALPVFPYRKFRHSFVYKRADSDMTDLGDLAGKNVATQSWQTTATVWIRGIAREYYGLDLEDVTWYRRKEDDVGLGVPDRFDVEVLPGEKEGDAARRAPVRKALIEGDLDVAMDPSGSLFSEVAESDKLDFLFDDPLAEEQRYFQETGIHPIMHVIVIRDEILDEHPWVALSVYEALCEARDQCLDRKRSPSADLTSTWSHLHDLEQQRIMGPPETVWEYGLTEKTRKELNTFVEYSHNQGLIPHEYDLDELFVDSTLDF